MSRLASILSPVGLVAAISLAACVSDTSADDATETSAAGVSTGSNKSADPTASQIKTVFLIMMENKSWRTILKHDKSAKYITRTLLPMGAHAEQYRTPAGLHPSEPNYIWLEAGDNLGITDDADPDKHHLSTREHFVSMLEAKGVSWKTYVEDIKGDKCPLRSDDLYATKHIPQLFFDDVTDGNSSSSQHCRDHVRPYGELDRDLASNQVARYNVIVPNLCHDMHGALGLRCPPPSSLFASELVEDGDKWLAAQVPKILNSQAYRDGGLLAILFDEGDEGVIGGTASDGPIPCILISPFAKPSFASQTPYTHSSMLRTLQTIFGVYPYLRGAATSNDLSDMFTSFP